MPITEKRPWTESEYQQARENAILGEKKYSQDCGLAYSSLKTVINKIDVGDFSGGAFRQALLTLLAEDTRNALQAGIPKKDIDRFDAMMKEVFEIEGLPGDHGYPIDDGVTKTKKSEMGNGNKRI